MPNPIGPPTFDPCREAWHRGTARVPTSVTRDGASGALSVRRAELPEQAGSAGSATVSGAVLDAAPDAAIGAAPAGSPPVAVAGEDLPSARLARLAELAASALDLAGTDPTGPVLTGQALADIWAAVDASTAVNTKKAYSSDWARFTTWTTQRGFCPLPAVTDGP